MCVSAAVTHVCAAAGDQAGLALLQPAYAHLTQVLERGLPAFMQVTAGGGGGSGKGGAAAYIPATGLFQSPLLLCVWCQARGSCTCCSVAHPPEQTCGRLNLVMDSVQLLSPVHHHIPP
jgi:hypothetical protein